MVDVYQIWCGRGHLTAIERGVYLCNHRPSLEWAAASPASVSGVELRDGGVDVVGVENDDRRHPLVGIDLDDREHLDAERVGPLVASRKSVMS